MGCGVEIVNGYILTYLLSMHSLYNVFPYFLSAEEISTFAKWEVEIQKNV